MIKGIIFDMDGTLLDAKDWHYQALNYALKFNGYDPISEEDHAVKFDGLPTKKKLEKLKVKAHHIDLICQDKQEMTLELLESEYVQNLDTLNALKILRNEQYKLALCSNSIRATVDAFLKISEYDHYLRTSFSNEDVSKPKPHPEMYTKACQALGLHPSEVLVLEDNINGIASAKGAGCHVLEVTGGVKQVTYTFIKSEVDRLDAISGKDEELNGVFGKYGETSK